jgi:NAD-dependent dihydropyrimidine dehydrogenase PreA subunit
MGHLHVAKEYSSLQKRLDKNPIGAPESEALYGILRIMFTEDEAALGAKMPMMLSTARTIARRVNQPADEVEKRLLDMADKGCVFDIKMGRRRYYMLNPTVVGFFEFSMMRLGDVPGAEFRQLAEYYDQYFIEGDFAKELVKGTQRIGRVLCHEQAYAGRDYADILPHEKARAIVEEATAWSCGVCFCRHKAHHLDKACGAPLDICLSLGFPAEYLINRNLARRIDKQEALDKLQQAYELNLVHIADNVKKNLTYVCNCCGCCCEQLQAINRLHLTNAVHTSDFIAQIDADTCKGCKKCERACPVDAITVKHVGERTTPKGRRVKVLKAEVNEDLCLGCGVCVRDCQTGSVRMERRGVRVFTPENIYEKVYLQAVERGKLQHLLFDNPESITHVALNGLLGAFLQLSPVKRALVSETLRSRFLRLMAGAQELPPGVTSRARKASAAQAGEKRPTDS